VGGSGTWRFQQRIRRRCMHALGRRDHRNLGSLAMAGQQHEIDERADALDRDGVDCFPFAGRFVEDGLLDPHEIGMLSRDRVAAARAHSAG